VRVGGVDDIEVNVITENYKKLLYLGYKNQSVYAVSGTSRCFSHINTKHGCNPLNTKRRPLYLKTQSVPRRKHFSSGL